MSDSTINLSDFEVGKPAILEPYWPDRTHRFVWRNWSLVDLDRMADVLGTDVVAVEAIGASLGLPEHQAISSDQWRRSYITIIRRNWHELPYEQLMQLLDWDEQHLAETLKEDDFLWHKLGCTKPRCAELHYEAPCEAVTMRAAEIRRTVSRCLADAEDLPYEPRFAFVKALSSPPSYAALTSDRAGSDDEVQIDGTWRIVFDADVGDVARGAAERYSQFLAASFGFRPAGDRGKAVHFAIEAQRFDRAESHEVSVSHDGVKIVAADEQGVLRAVQYLQRQMQDRCAPLLTVGTRRRDTQFHPRYLYSYFALYGDPLMEPETDPYPEGYLERLSELGVNGVWMQAVLRTLAPSKDFPEFGEGWPTRLANLRKMVDKARRYGIGIWLYLNEPRSMPDEFFVRHPEAAGAKVPYGSGRVMCTSAEPVRRFLVESTAHIFSQVPDLAGAFTITRSENPTSCWSHNVGDQCPRCSKRGEAEVVADVSRLIAEGAQQGSKHARVIAWDWGWRNEMSEQTIQNLSSDIAFMSVSEWDTPIVRGGTESTVGEYCVSVVGPGPRAKRNWQAARKRGLDTIAKVAFNNSWEFSAAPHMMVADTAARHCQNLVESGVSGLMLGWTLGGCPSPSLEVAGQFYWADAQTADEALSNIASHRYGAASESIGLSAWRAVAEALSEYPFSVGVVYSAPAQMGCANPLYPEPTGYPASMVGIPYDDVDRWRGPYPAEVLAEQYAKTADGLGHCVELLGSIADSAPEPYQQHAREDHRFVLAMRITFASIANQVRFVLARDALRDTDDPSKARALLDTLESLISDELDLARQLHALACADSRIGYEATNHYYYVPLDLVEKAINCQWLLDTWLADQRRRLT